MKNRQREIEQPKYITDIIKALECCINGKCNGCPLYAMNCSPKVAMAFSADFINRQKAEIEVQGRTIKNLQATVLEVNQYFDKNVAEAIKEFAERLKEAGTFVTSGKGFEGVYVMASNLQIDSLVKEMVGDPK